MWTCICISLCDTLVQGYIYTALPSIIHSMVVFVVDSWGMWRQSKNTYWPSVGMMISYIVWSLYRALVKQTFVSVCRAQGEGANATIKGVSSWPEVAGYLFVSQNDPPYIWVNCPMGQNSPSACVVLTLTCVTMTLDTMHIVGNACMYMITFLRRFCVHMLVPLIFDKYLRGSNKQRHT